MDFDETERMILEDPLLFRFSRLSKEEGRPLFLVGGYLRDLFLGKVKKDYDFALPERDLPLLSAMERLLGFRFFKAGGKEAGKVTYRMTRETFSLDVTPFEESGIAEDLQRRDFTVNAFAYDLQGGAFHWVKEGPGDIERRVIRAVSDRAIDRDPLRMLRAVRYLCTLEGFVLDPGLREQIEVKAGKIAGLPGERIRPELDHILLSLSSAAGLRLLRHLGLLFVLFPEMTNLDQEAHSPVDALDHAFLTIEKLPGALDWVRSRKNDFSVSDQGRLCLSYAVLLQNIGSRDSSEREKVLDRLRFSNRMRKRVLSLVRHHGDLSALPKGIQERVLRRLVHRLEEDAPLLVLYALAEKEAGPCFLSLEEEERLGGRCLRILDLYERKEIVHPLPFVTGEDVTALGYPPGPEVGRILGWFLGKQVDGELETREEALKVLRERFGPDRETPKG